MVTGGGVWTPVSLIVACHAVNPALTWSIRCSSGAKSLPTKKIGMGITTIGASCEKPKPAMAFWVTPTNSSRVKMTVGRPSRSNRAAARPQAVAQAPQAAFPTTTASAPLGFHGLHGFFAVDRSGPHRKFSFRDENSVRVLGG